MDRKVICKWMFPVLVMLLGVMGGRAEDVYFKHVEMQNGLSNSQINVIFKDSKGFMWFGTASGLNRWDGYQMKVFMSDSRNARSLPDNYIESIQEARDGVLWIRTGGGYVIYDPRTEDFDREVSSVLAKMGVRGVPRNIRIDRNHNIWINVKGDGVYYYKTGMHLVHQFAYSDEQHGLPEGDIDCLDECREGMILCYTDGRLVCVNGEKKKVVWQEDYIAQNGGLKNDDYHAFADRKDNIWVWNRSRLYIFKKASGSWLNSLQDLADDWKTTAPSLVDNRIRGIAQDMTGKLWLATEHSGIILVDPNEKSIRVLEIDPNNIRSLRSNNIQSLFVDNTGLVWIGSAKYGVSYYADGIFRFQADWLGDVTALTQDGEGNFWIGTSEQGILIRDGKTGGIRNLTRSGSGLSSDYVSSLVVSGNRIWAGSPRGGVDWIENGKVSHLQSGPDGTALHTNNVQALCTDAHGNLWIGTQGFGLQCWNAQTGNFTTYNVESGHLRSDNVTALKRVGSRLLIGTGAGLTVMQLEGRKCQTYVGNIKGDISFRSTSVTCAWEDSRGLYWAGTREGLAIYSPKTDQLALLGKDEGLENELVLGLLEDPQHNLWVTTASGVSQIIVQPDQHANFSYVFHVYNYDRNDGLQAEFNTNAVWASADGILCFGGMAGINWINQKQKENRKIQERIFFTQLYVNGDEVEIGRSYGGRVILSSSLSTAREIILPYGADVIVKLAGDNYKRAEKLQYLYRLDGVDDAWRTGDAMFHGISYQNLSGGTYTLHVKTFSSEGSNEESVLILKVAPPVWFSWWAIAGYVLLFILLVAWWTRWRPKHKARKSRYQALKDRELQLKELAEEFRSPVLTMIPPLNALADDEVDDKKREYLTTVHFQAVQILNLVNRMQDFFHNGKIEDTLSAVKVKNRQEIVPESEVVEKELGPVVAESKPRLLIVDDNPEFLEFVRFSLEGRFEVLTASSADQAWKLIVDEVPDLIICESDMGEMSGSELCSRLKSNRELDRIPFILVTDSASAAMIGDNGINNLITTSADDYIAKPFNIQVLISHVNQLLGIHMESMELQQVEKEESAIESKAISATMDEQLRINAEQFVLQNISRTTLSVEEMAKSLNMSRAHLYKKLTAITGKTPIEFIRAVRLRQAALLLRQGTFNVSEVAYEIGFNNPKNFSKYFKDEYGVSPSQYINDNRKL